MYPRSFRLPPSSVSPLHLCSLLRHCQWNVPPSKGSHGSSEGFLSPPRCVDKLRMRRRRREVQRKRKGIRVGLLLTPCWPDGRKRRNKERGCLEEQRSALFLCHGGGCPSPPPDSSSSSSPPLPLLPPRLISLHLASDLLPSLSLSLPVSRILAQSIQARFLVCWVHPKGPLLFPLILAVSTLAGDLPPGWAWEEEEEEEEEEEVWAAQDTSRERGREGLSGNFPSLPGGGGLCPPFPLHHLPLPLCGDSSRSCPAERGGGSGRRRKEEA